MKKKTDRLLVGQNSEIGMIEDQDQEDIMYRVVCCSTNYNWTVIDVLGYFLILILFLMFTF